MSQMIVITAIGQDRPGIIAALSKAVYDLGGNFEDATMTRLHGAFAAMLAAKLPSGITETDAKLLLSQVAEQNRLSLTVHSVTDPAPPEALADYLITVYGADHPGIVHKVTEHLSHLGINITDMDTRVAGSSDAPIYIMLIEVASNGAKMEHDFEIIKAQLHVDISLSPLQTEAL